MSELYLNLVFVLVYGALAALYLAATVCNWIFVESGDWGIEEGKDLWQDVRFAVLVAFPVLNWAVLITTVYHWFAEKK